MIERIFDGLLVTAIVLIAYGIIASAVTWIGGWLEGFSKGRDLARETRMWGAPLAGFNPEGYDKLYADAYEVRSLGEFTVDPELPMEENKARLADYLDVVAPTMPPAVRRAMLADFERNAYPLAVAAQFRQDLERLVPDDFKGKNG